MHMITKYLLSGVFMTFGWLASAQTTLFNGKDLTGWQVYGTEKWYVENGELVCESRPDKQYGYLATEKVYRTLN
jgi:hypothetical protein